MRPSSCKGSASDLQGRDRALRVGRRLRDARTAGWHPEERRRTHRLDRRTAGTDREDRRAELSAVEHGRSEEHTSELQSLMRISYAVFCLKKKKEIKY